MRRLAILPSLMLAGCTAAAIDAPSLQTRAVERVPIVAPDATSEPETPAPPALVARLTTLVADAHAAHERFERERIATERLSTRAGTAAEGSEAWIQAQQARSALDAARGPLREIASEIDALRQDPANFGTGARAAIDTAAAEVETLSAAEAQAAG